ncbi:hypothetical protein ACU8WE_28975 [Pseudomonas parakoreensis]
MPEIDYERLSPPTKRKIAALALKKGWSIEQALEEVGIEFVAMGGPSLIGRPKGKLYQLMPKEGLKSDS